MTIRRLLAGAALAACPLLASAAEITEPLLVTPNRTPLTADETLASVSVITRQDIERRQPRDLPDLLADLPGVHIARNGGRGQSSSLFLRGTNSNQTLVLVDGVRVASATTGAAALANIPVEQIERIELVRGPRSSLYGADAVGGVVQIFTRTPETGVGVGAGNRGTRNLRGSLGWQTGSGDFGITANRFASDGYDVIDASGTDGDDDGYTENSLSLRGRYAPTRALSVRGSLLQSNGEVEFDNGPPDETENTNRVVSLSADYVPAANWQARASLGRARDDGDSRMSGGGRFTTERDQASAQFTFQTQERVITTLGVDAYKEAVSGTVQYDESSRYNVGAFLQQRWFLGAWDVEVSGRYDDNEAYGETTTGSFAVGYAFTTDWRAFASVGSAFRAPSFNELYFPGFGNSGLDPERSRTWEVGLSYGGPVRVSLSAYRTAVDDLIAGFPVTNVDEATIRGAEGSVTAPIGAFEVSLDASYTDPRNEADDTLLPRRPQRQFALRVERTVGALSLSTTLAYASESFDDPGEQQRIDEYTVVDAALGYRLAPSWQLRISVDNLLDEDYATALAFTDDPYRAPGRTAFVSLRWQPEAGGDSR